MTYQLRRQASAPPVDAEREAIIDWLAHRCEYGPSCGRCTYCTVAIWIRSRVGTSAPPNLNAAQPDTFLTRLPLPTTTAGAQDVVIGQPNAASVDTLSEDRIRAAVTRWLGKRALTKDVDELVAEIVGAPSVYNACPHCQGERSLGDCQVTQRLVVG